MPLAVHQARGHGDHHVARLAAEGGPARGLLLRRRRRHPPLAEVEGPVDIVLEPRGFEAGYTALVARSTTVRRGDIEIPVGALAHLIRSKELLRRAKDIEHLAAPYDHFPLLAAGSGRPPPTPE